MIKKRRQQIANILLGRTLLIAIAITIAATADAPIIGPVDDTNGRGRLAARPIGGVTEYAGTGDTFGVRTGAIAIASTG